jgi:phosphoenolpyruvate carboxylase
MLNSSYGALQQFKNEVGLKFQLYNSLFIALPFHQLEKTGILLSVFLNNCEEGFALGWSPTKIIDDFFKRHTNYSKDSEKIDLLFRFVQYVERQVVLFDALEDAAFADVNDMQGIGTLKHLQNEIGQSKKEEELAQKLKDFSIRLVLTAHPTQFYPGSVLGIINDLSKELANNNTAQVNMYLMQLGKTPFLKQQKPTPYDEAVSLIWYLENVFYKSIGKIISNIKGQFPNVLNKDNSLIKMGFWPGGDRDGNPFVTADITWKVANALRGSIIKCYYMDIRKLRRRLTFKHLDEILGNLEQQLYNNIFIPNKRTEISKKHILKELQKVQEILRNENNGLYINLVNSLVNKVEVFGLHFATLDVRQESKVHAQVLKHIPPNKLKILGENALENTTITIDQTLIDETIKSFKVIKKIQKQNGVSACERYIISQCNTANHVLEVFELFLQNGWKENELHIDIVPLFETIEDLHESATIMETLYTHPIYAKHLHRRNKTQTIMLGFSDGTKDGGYLMANWSIYKAKESLTALSEKYNLKVVFFDGRGGPPARGGGKTHKFYASMGKNIANKEIQLTVQGQTVSSNFGTIDAAQFNMEQLLHAGISNSLFSTKEITLEASEEKLLQSLAEKSLKAYLQLKNSPLFLDYLTEVSPLKYYADTNIGSRPTKRNANNKLMLKDLRAIPFVGAWSQIKQNLTGYYGLGLAMQEMEKEGNFEALKKLFKNSLFFKTLMQNSEMAMKKSFFPLTQHLSKDEKYGTIWKDIYTEYERTKKYVMMLSETNALMENYPVEKLSVEMREKIVLPLITIQQYSITKIRNNKETKLDNLLTSTFEKLIIRCSFGIINASRNSA